MASLHVCDGNWHVSFRYGGTQFKASLGIAYVAPKGGGKASPPDEATERLADIRRCVRELDEGRGTLPPDADKATTKQYILTGGRLLSKPVVRKSSTLSNMIDPEHGIYFSTYTAAKQANTIIGEKIHAGHFLRILGKATPMETITTAKLQRDYVGFRLKEDGQRGRKLSGDTIRKELRTFAQMWKAARTEGYVTGDSPTRGVSLPLSDEKEPFRTWQDIERLVSRSGLSDNEIQTYWDSLFLDEAQVLELLKYVRKKASLPFILPMFAFAAFTGARRSEILNSRIEDWDFEKNIVRIREKKGSKKKNVTFREVPIHPRLAKIMRHWFTIHPGTLYAVAVPGNLPRSKSDRPQASQMTIHQARDFFKRTLNGSKWKVLRGFHVFRHSFCSNCARRGFPETLIDSMMGHRGDEEIKRRYRHLFPQDAQALVSKMFSREARTGAVAAK
jgi:integrase